MHLELIINHHLPNTFGSLLILSADIYGFLINYKYPFSMVMQRAKYYKFAFCAIFETIYGIPASKLGVRFEHESTYHLEKENITNLLKMIALTAQQDIRATGEELKHTPMLSPLLCPAVQALNQQIFDADIEFGGLDQVSFITSTYSEHSCSHPLAQGHDF